MYRVEPDGTVRETASGKFAGKAAFPDMTDLTPPQRLHHLLIPEGAPIIHYNPADRQIMLLRGDCQACAKSEKPGFTRPLRPCRGCAGPQCPRCGGEMVVRATELVACEVCQGAPQGAYEANFSDRIPSQAIDDIEVEVVDGGRALRRTTRAIGEVARLDFPTGTDELRHLGYAEEIVRAYMKDHNGMGLPVDALCEPHQPEADTCYVVSKVRATIYRNEVVISRIV